MLDKKIWAPIDNNSTGYVGKHRNEEWAKRDAEFGKDNWEMAWLVGDDLLDYGEACNYMKTLILNILKCDLSF